MKYIMVTLFLVFMSCTNTSMPKVADETSITEEIEIKASTWEDFWTLFQYASQTNNIDDIKALTDFNYGLSEQDFEEYYDVFFSASMRNAIDSTKAADVKLNEHIPVDIEEGREMMLYETGESDGITYESALFLYFGKVDDSYKMVLWMAAG